MYWLDLQGSEGNWHSIAISLYNILSFPTRYAVVLNNKEAKQFYHSYKVVVKDLENYIAMRRFEDTISSNYYRSIDKENVIKSLTINPYVRTQIEIEKNYWGMKLYKQQKMNFESLAQLSLFHSKENGLRVYIYKPISNGLWDHKTVKDTTEYWRILTWVNPNMIKRNRMRVINSFWAWFQHKPPMTLTPMGLWCMAREMNPQDPHQVIKERNPQQLIIGGK